MKRLLDLFKRKSDIVEYTESKYGVCINDRLSWFDTKDAMIKHIDDYSKLNTIYSLSMFKMDLFNLIK